jgi:hypothetical protein
MSRALALRLGFIAVLVVATAAALMHYRGDDEAGISGDRPLTIHFTCDTSGRLEPCGCFTGQHGGLTRLRTWLERRETKGPALAVDVGGVIAGDADYDFIQYGYLARAFDSMGFEALNMGASEAAVPPAKLRELAADSPVPMLSASLVDPATRREILRPSRVVEREGLRIGILGVVSPDSVPKPHPDLAILGLNEAIDRQLPGLVAETDIRILLAFASEPEMRRLARDYFEFDLILGGDVDGSAQQLIRENDSILLYTSGDGRTVGPLETGVDPAARPRLVDPDYDVQLLWENIPQHPELTALVRDHRKEIRETPLDIDRPNPPDPNAVPGVAPIARYVGSENCQACHTTAHADWDASGHAHAFETLVRAGADADPHCIQCHTVGFGRPGGYRRPMGDEKLVGVGCESCHGPGSEHVDRHLHGKPNRFEFRPLGPGDCTSCHHGEFSRPFDWEKFWPEIEHFKESDYPDTAE